LPELTSSSQIILTGGIGAGKSTYAKKLLQKANLQVAGLVTERVIEDSVTVGYAMREIGGESHIFAHRKFIDKPQFYEYGLDLTVFENIGCDILKRAVHSGLPILIDELGVMEQNAAKFCKAVHEIISGDKPYFIVIQQRALNFWLGGIRHGEVVEVTRENREQLVIYHAD
jgi:nucleoside-triphosphatase THEP1